LSAAEVNEEERYKRIGLDFEAVDWMLVAVFLQAHREAPKQIVLDLDSTDDPLQGEQEGRFCHGYYGNYCYLPWYLCGGSPGWVRGCARRISRGRQEAGRKSNAW
jgi:hypothetical protein